MGNMSKLRLITFTLRMCLAIVILVTSSISIFMDSGDVWKAVFCLALLNIVDLSEKEI
jgi:hypothetical protein